MEQNNRAKKSAMAADDDANRRLFESLLQPNLVRELIRIKHNDPTEIYLCLWSHAQDLDGKVWSRVGCILHQNTNVRTLNIANIGNVDAVRLCDGLQHNRSIEELSLYHDAQSLNSLVPFLSNNYSLKAITLSGCDIYAATMNILSNAIAHHAIGIKELEFNRCNLSHESTEILTNALLNCSGGPLEALPESKSDLVLLLNPNVTQWYRPTLLFNSVTPFHYS